jgi:hypothetical protein
VLPISLACRPDHLRRAVDRGDSPAFELLANEGDRHAVATADLEDAVTGREVEDVDRPAHTIRRTTGHARMMPSRCAGCV